ncbi:hypothetical protein L0657_07620 [Dyadobacter sp. CY345]|uniref:hypothetical protein n=1 Tax=Dyadobacter sp. CY345 TaxID=2909335 RepID=UPI001F45C2B3|nr:hypothetical protein [Dyadobacter sp. CY345]MCF2443821.1 hypothetical protein [Dyadobacter sp. CY345]
MPHNIKSEKTSLDEIHAFLLKIEESNEDTEYSSDQEYIVNAIIELARVKGRMPIIQDFEKTYIHPLITIQKWIEELKLITNEAINDITYGSRHSLFKKKITEMNGYDVSQFIIYLKEDGLIK